MSEIYNELREQLARAQEGARQEKIGPDEEKKIVLETIAMIQGNKKLAMRHGHAAAYRQTESEMTSRIPSSVPNFPVEPETPINLNRNFKKPCRAIRSQKMSWLRFATSTRKIKKKLQKTPLNIRRCPNRLTKLANGILDLSANKPRPIILILTRVLTTMTKP